MHLINTTSLAIEYFQTSSDTPYGVLSHRWHREEITYQDVLSGNANHKQGYQKFVKTCEQARKDGLSYVWIDTCCIDKSSSAELSEAINSMFAWYRDAQVCFAYLADVDNVGDLEHSAWFTRGWTLQELVAPRSVEFFTSNWTKLGNKHDLGPELSRITGIPATILDGQEILARRSIAQRMSWAACRSTTRLEDRAYSLLGIFGINMPLLYGEGSKAFVRLQEEIIKQTDDHSIFAWRLDAEVSNGDNDITASGLLAESPEYFAGCSHITRREPPFQLSTFSITNRGLSIRLPLIPWSHNFIVALLNCADLDARSPMSSCTVGIFLREVDEPGQYARVNLNGQYRVLYDDTCFKKNGYYTRSDTMLWYQLDARMVEAVFYRRTAAGPVLYKLGTIPQYCASSRHYSTRDLYIRQSPLELVSFKPGKPREIWIRRFTPFQKDSDFNPKDDFSIRCWNNWDMEKRRVLIPEGFGSEVCFIYVPGKRMNKIDDPSVSDLDVEDEKTLTVSPSMFLRVMLGIRYEKPHLILTDNLKFEGSMPLTPDPRPDNEIMNDERLVPLISDPRPDIEVLNDKQFVSDSFNNYRDHTLNRKVFITTEIINGIETFVLDLLWSGARSRCDECGKVLTQRQYCCVSCSSPQYDCCGECFKELSKTRHDAKPGNEHHRFRTVPMGRYNRLNLQGGEEAFRGEPRLLL